MERPPAQHMSTTHAAGAPTPRRSVSARTLISSAAALMLRPSIARVGGGCLGAPDMNAWRDRWRKTCRAL